MFVSWINLSESAKMVFTQPTLLAGGGGFNKNLY